MVPTVPSLLVSAVNGVVMARDRQTGHRIWVQMLPGAEERTNSVQGGEVSWSTMRLVVDAPHVFVFAMQLVPPGKEPRPVVTCFDLASGRILWNAIADNDLFRGGTLLVDGDQVFVADGYYVEAFSRLDGRVLWRDVFEGPKSHRGATWVMSVALAVQGKVAAADRG